MTNKILLALALAPLVAFAQGAGPGPAAKAGQGPGFGNPERMEKRMRLARTLGLAEALDLDSAQALKLGDAIAKFDERRLAAHQQLHDAKRVLRNAARGDKVPAADVDKAIQKALDARTQIQAVDREVLATVTKDLTPEKKARAVLFLEKFQGRFGPGPGMMRGAGMHRGRGMGMGAGGGGMGMGPGGGMGMGPDGGMGMGMGPGGMGMGMGPGAGPGAMAGSCPNPDCPWTDDDE